MTIPTETKELLLRLRERIPPDRRDAFVAAVNARLGELATRNLVYYTLFGALAGYLIGRLPMVGWLTEHHQTEIGALIGTWVGLTKDHEERQRRQNLQAIIQEALHHALA